MTLSDANVPAPLTTLPRERLIDRVVGAIKDYIIANRIAVHPGDVSTDDGAQLGEGWAEP